MSAPTLRYFLSPSDKLSGARPARTLAPARTATEPLLFRVFRLFRLRPRGLKSRRALPQQIFQNVQALQVLGLGFGVQARSGRPSAGHTVALSRRFLDMRRALPSGDGETTDSEVLANTVREFDVCR